MQMYHYPTTFFRRRGFVLEEAFNRGILSRGILSGEILFMGGFCPFAVHGLSYLFYHLSRSVCLFAAVQFSVDSTSHRNFTKPGL